MKDKTIALVSIGAMISLVESIALLTHVDGQMLATTISALVGMFGYFMGRREK